MKLLLGSVAIGLLTGLIRAWIGGRHLMPPSLQQVWLVPVAIVPQLFAFYLPATQSILTDSIVAVGLVTSQVLLLVFAWFNRHLPGFWLLGLGLALNLLVIILNGGLMPISPETVARLLPDASPDIWEFGSRFRNSKDIILPVAETRLWFLSDRFFLSLPSWFGGTYRVAFSLGDVFIAIGSFWVSSR